LVEAVSVDVAWTDETDFVETAVPVVRVQVLGAIDVICTVGWEMSGRS
jgi:hypothetical protein